MKFKIDRIALNNITYDRFVNEYLIPEKPLIFTGVNTFNVMKMKLQ